MYDVIIVGAGPAGLTAALYAGRAKLKTRVLEKLSIGGQILLTELIENFPGVHKMNSYDWVEIVKKQLAELACVQVTQEVRVEKIEPADNFFRVRIFSLVDNTQGILESRCVILAVGAQPKRIGIKGEEVFIGRGVSYCGTCDGPLFKNKEVAIIGGGETALEEALYLRKFAKKLTVIHRRDRLRASALLCERAASDEKIKFKLEAVPLEICGRARVEGIKIKNLKSNNEEFLSCDGVFVFIGVTADTGFLKGLLELNEAGQVKTDENMAASLAGIFSCGDCRVRPFNQIVTACSDGAIAAYSAAKFLEPH